MSKVDIIFAIPLLWGAFMGFRKGLILELASLVGLILGIFGALKFSDFTASKLTQWTEVPQEWLGLLSFLITFIVIVFAVFIFAKILNKAIKLVALGLINRLLGMCFGIIKYALILSTLLYFFENFNSKFHFTESNFQKKSILYAPLKIVTAPFKELMENFEMDKAAAKAKEFNLE